MGTPPRVLEAAVTSAPIDPGALLAVVGGAGDGAVLLFLGTVRDTNEGRPVKGIRYEAYEEMAGAVLAEVAAEAAARLGSGSLAVVHRVGELAVGEVSVAIAVSSAHRAAAYEASRHVIEEIKKRLPVWKHEHYTDGGSDWVRGQDPVAGAAAAARGEGEDA
jgi:molybdopterin synthase catalytic subunit